jgi:hypothetical protein
MKSKHVACCVFISVFLYGCASTDEIKFDTTKRVPTTTLDVYHFDSGTPNPTKSFKIIASLNFLGERQDGAKARRYFIRRAKKLGANGVIMESPGYGGTSGNIYGVSTKCYFKAKAIVYE